MVDGSCPTHAGEVMVSTADVEANGWTVGSKVDVARAARPRALADVPGEGTVTIVGVYEPPPRTPTGSAPRSPSRAGTVIPDVGFATDDWVTSPESMSASGGLAVWYQVSSTVVWPLDTDAVDHDALLRIGPVVERVRQQMRGQRRQRRSSSRPTCPT